MIGISIWKTMPSMYKNNQDQFQAKHCLSEKDNDIYYIFVFLVYHLFPVNINSIF